MKNKKRLDPKYEGIPGFEGFQLKPEKPGHGYRFLIDGEQFLAGDEIFDAYSGWIGKMTKDSYLVKNEHHLWDRPDKLGRWIAYRRKIIK